MYLIFCLQPVLRSVNGNNPSNEISVFVKKFRDIGWCLSCYSDDFNLDSFLDLLSVEGGFPFYFAIVQAVKKFDPTGKLYKLHSNGRKYLLLILSRLCFSTIV
jgi:hypothetical protein